MKKFIFLLIASAVSLAVSAQVKNLKGTYGSNLDTVANAGTVYLTSVSGDLDAIGLNGNYDLQVTARSISGSVSVTFVLQSSIDGTNWQNHFKAPGQDGVNCDTLVIGAAGTHVWTIRTGAVKTIQSSGVVINQWYTNSGRRLRFRLKAVGLGTQSTEIKSQLITQN